MATVTATLQVSFTGADEASDAGPLVLEVDARENGLNQGKTAFRPGDPVYYLLFAPDGFTLAQHVVTAGSRASAGSGNKSIEQILTFNDAREASLSYPVASITSKAWIGNNQGASSLAGDGKIVLPENKIGILRVNYKSSFAAYRLSGVPNDVDRVLIVVQGEVA